MLKGVKPGDKFYITIYDTLTGEAILLKKNLFYAEIKVLDYVTCYSCQGPLISDVLIVGNKDIAGYTTKKGKTYEKKSRKNIIKSLINKFLKIFRQYKEEVPF